MEQNKQFILCQMTETRNSFWSWHSHLSAWQHRATDLLKACEKGIPLTVRPAYVKFMIFKVPSNPYHSMILW